MVLAARLFMTMTMAYTIDYTASAEGDIAYFRTYEQVLIVDAIDHQLTHEPGLETRNRKVLDPTRLPRGNCASVAIGCSMMWTR